MKWPRALSLRIKLIGSLIIVVLLASLASYISIQLSLGKITGTIIPSLQVMGQTRDLFKSIQAETLGFVAAGDEDTIEDVDNYSAELETLAAQQETAQTTILRELFREVETAPQLGREIIEAHRQTLTHLETLEELEEATESLFEQLDNSIEAEIARNLQAGETAELLEDAIPTLRYGKEFINEARTLQAELLQFISSGDENARQDYTEALERMQDTQAKLETVLEADEAGEAELAAGLTELRAAFETTGAAIFETHTQTLALLAELEDLEERPSGAIAATQQAVEQEVQNGLAEANRNAALSALAILLLATALGFVVTNTVVRPIYRLVDVARQIGNGDFTIQAQVESQDEVGELAQSFNQMTGNLRQRIQAEAQAKEEAETANKSLAAQVWQTTGQAQLNDKMRGEQDVPVLANNIIQQLCHYLQAQVGGLYLVEDQTLNLAGRYAYTNKNPVTRFKFGEGLVGQAALEQRPVILTDVPAEYITVTSGLGETLPQHIIVTPFMYNDEVVGVIELATLSQFSQAHLDFIQTAQANIAIAFHTAQARARINELLAETQQQAEELQVQGEELQSANEELESQTESLRTSEAKLKEKQIELEASNIQLKEKAGALEESSLILRQKQATLDQQNQDLKIAQQALEQKAQELALASKYKSEFLANMSHELRTPLNSLLILAGMLAHNTEGNLTPKQVESAQIIYSGGTDLLNLINDILDLAKVESGKMRFTIEAMPLAELVTLARSQFAHVAAEKGLDLEISLADDLPASIKTDSQRVKQIIRNLLSNAFKFTSQGSVSLKIYRPEATVDLSRSGLLPAQTVAIAVTDTGIGIPSEQQKIIFEAFQQADGGANRQYSGTGLGLSISRELAAKLGGQIGVYSEPGKGSTFTLYLPQEPTAGQPEIETKVQEPKVEWGETQPAYRPAVTPAPQSSPSDDRAELEAGDKILLLIEDDPEFAKVVYDFAHQKAFKCLIAPDGYSGLALVKSYKPGAVILDLNLPDISGWEVLQQLKDDPATRHIPVHIISVDEEVLDAYRKGAMGYLTKPVSPEKLAESFHKIEQFIAKTIKTLLLVEDDANARHSLKKLLEGNDLQISEADRGQVALDLLHSQHFDCMILDLSLPDMTGFELLNTLNSREVAVRCPIIVYTGRELTPEENLELMKYANSVIVKGVKSPERLLDETALFLHRVVAEMPEEKQQTIKQLYNADGLLKGKRILIVDDDVRNSFALSKLLTEKGVIINIAQNGQKALDLLAAETVDLVLMDIMMPVMDGYETMQRIRAQQQFKTLPILALTAKAMKGDREKCLAAGANDYLPKPIDVNRLFTLLRIWLYQ
jgi:CheY-like chemotaxis protein